jgi:hypothetical protein
VVSTLDVGCITLMQSDGACYHNTF